MSRSGIIHLHIIILLYILEYCNCGPINFQLNNITRETNLMNFVRLLVMRLIYGVAKMMGLSENLSEFANGALVPPGADEYDDYGFADRDSYYDY